MTAIYKTVPTIDELLQIPNLKKLIIIGEIIPLNILNQILCSFKI